MRRSLSYADAVSILGGQSKVMKHLDRVSAGALLALGGFNFIEVRREIVSLGEELVRSVRDRIRGADRITRTERLLAAHTVIVITAYFEELGEALDSQGAGRAVRFTAGEQISLANSESVKSQWREVVSALATTIQPTPLRSRRSTCEFLTSYYAELSNKIGRFITGLAVWDDLDETQQGQLIYEIREVPSRAVAKYEELYAHLATDCAEFAVWANLADHSATRAEVRGGLAAVEDLLRAMASELLPDDRRAALSRAYLAALNRPIAADSQGAIGLQFPTLGEGYIDHRFRIAELDSSAAPARPSWWDSQPVCNDLYRFLVAHLVSPQAQEAPLLVLGHPGSGKSVLTRMLAARLPATDFLPVRVELRQVSADGDVQDQIESAVRADTGESLRWPRLVESANGALPVVILDGFDELLQATGVTHTDFLMNVARFQEREADQGRPVAVVVTSRTAVADRAAVPPGTIGVHLEPFDDDQVGTWLDLWNRTNSAAFEVRKVRALPVEVALTHRDLAEQPLLLLMLALYDADANALQEGRSRLDRTELYERLLEDFARREVCKQSGALPPTEVVRLVELELFRLSIVAFAMFNRRVQWVDEASLNADLAALRVEREDRREHRGLQAALSAAQIVLGRFFFVHESQATRDDRQLQTYEFLHATFGEFLVARLAVRIVTDMASREAAPTYLTPMNIDDGLMHALLSFEVLAARAPIIEFLCGFIGMCIGPAIISAVALSAASGNLPAQLASSGLTTPQTATVAGVAHAGRPFALLGVPLGPITRQAAGAAAKALSHGLSVGLVICGCASLVAAVATALWLRESGERIGVAKGSGALKPATIRASVTPDVVDRRPPRRYRWSQPICPSSPDPGR